MDKYAQELVKLTAESQELQKQIDATGLLKMKQGVDEAIVALKEKMKDAVEAGVLATGKQDATLPNGDILSIEPRKGKTSVEVSNIDEVDDEYRNDEVVENGGVLEDGTMYTLLDSSEGFYADGTLVKKKSANLELIANLVKLGQNINGVLVKKSRPSIIIRLNGKVLK